MRAIDREKFGVRFWVRIGFVGAALVLGGCGLGEWARNGAKVGPNYAPATAPVADRWIDFKDEPEATEPPDLSRWWSVFNDPVLDGLIADAEAQNLSLRTAGERITESRARRAVIVGNIAPQLQEFNASYTHNKGSNRASGGLDDQWFQNWEAGFNVSWELDLWGRFRRSIESADADLDASIADFDNVMVTLLADVSANYVQYRTFQERIAIAKNNVVIQEKSYQLASDKLQAGASTERDAQQAKQVLEQTRASIPLLETGERQASNALCVLLGIAPRDLSARLQGAGKIPNAPPQLALGVPADLLRRRPDVRAAERRAAEQSALIGVAKADLYPRFSILGSIGIQSAQFDDLFETPASMTGSIGPSFQWNLFNYGRLTNAVQVQESRFRQSVLAFQDTVLRANREAEDAVVGFLKGQQRVKYLDLSVAAAIRTVEITNDQYREGVIDFTPVFLFEGTLAEQQDQLAIARSEIALNLIDLYRAMGGGWEARLHDQTPSTRPVEAAANVSK